MKTIFFISALLLIQITGLSQAEAFHYQLIYAKFNLDKTKISNESLAESIPEYLTTDLSRSPFITNLAIGDDQKKLLEEIEYQYDNFDIHDRKTISEIGKQVGANALLIGKISSSGDKKIRVDAKIAIIETRVKDIEKYIIRSGSKFGKTAPYTKAMRCLAKQIRKEIEGYGSPKRWMGAAVVSFIASASLSFGAYSMQNKYNNAKTIPELDKYKNSRNNYLTGAGACFLAAGASVIIYIDLNKKNRQRKSVVKN
ncbi:MAG: hypothetical protein H6557_02480 [Lewinellaceae bacterium]|nr:hypothetical protein [Phaeodactylibacter sp.]MCB9035465.1 hypothetical protein [Lewinellaceae bacterium]